MLCLLVVGRRITGKDIKDIKDIKDTKDYKDGEPRRSTGGPWLKTAALARAAIAGGQVKRKLGIENRA